MIIRHEQLAAMRKHMLDTICSRFLKRLISDLVLTNDVDANQALREISELMEDGAALGITDEEHVYRLLRFRYLAAPLLAAPLIQSVIIRVLHHLAWSVEKRLAFLETQILPKVCDHSSHKPPPQQRSNLPSH